MARNPHIAPYSRRAQHFFDQYQSLAFDAVHAAWAKHLPTQPGFALDAGAGSGRDAAALAGRGWDVVAVEPADELRQLGDTATQGLAVQWLNDRLPELALVRSLGYRFELILVSAVWMHLAPSEQERAFRVLSELLAPGGVLVVTLRHGPNDNDRVFHPVDSQAMEAWARNRALVTLQSGQQPDQLKRDAVHWKTLVFRLPDDGTGALPLMRHIIVNDNKSSTYKLGLLRTLTRIADGLPGMVLRRTDDWVELPLGMVALYWVKLYLPLLSRHQLRQTPGKSGYGFAKQDFYNLHKVVSAYDLRVGQRLSEDTAPVVLRSLRDAAATICKMPAYYITWPGTDRSVFEAEPGSFRIASGSARLDLATLARFGTFRVPTFLWDCCSRYACWLEPAIVNEWVELMQGYEVRYDTGTYHAALQWQEGRRDTTVVRTLVNQRLAAQRPVNCVWSQQNLKAEHYAIDHCFPWARWANNDLWNLLPSSVRANSQKAEKLPGSRLLHTARPDIVEWWSDAFAGSDREQQFYSEAESALPLVRENHNLEAVFEGLMQQRLRLKMNQQLAEWHGLGGIKNHNADRPNS